MRIVLATVWLASLVGSGAALAVTATYGDQDLFESDNYVGNPVGGATLEGLAPDVVTFANLVQSHGWPFSPENDDFSGTDQIYVGSNQSAAEDGYAGSQERIEGPQVLQLDYSALFNPNTEAIATFTLGILADDFQFPRFGNPYAATINGGAAAALTGVLNGLDQTGPLVQFFSIGIDPSVLDPGHVLTLSIDQGGNGGDGWAIDFLTVGITTTPIPIPAPLPLFVFALALIGKFSNSGRPVR